MPGCTEPGAGRAGMRALCLGQTSPGGTSHHMPLDPRSKGGIVPPNQRHEGTGPLG